MAREFAKTFYKSKEWKMVRDYCLKRDAYMCVMCSAPAEEVHHIVHLSPANIGDPKVALNPDNLMCLCRDCHFEQHRGEHAKGRKIQEDYPYTFDENGQLIPKPDAALPPSP